MQKKTLNRLKQQQHQKVGNGLSAIADAAEFPGSTTFTENVSKVNGDARASSTFAPKVSSGNNQVGAVPFRLAQDTDDDSEHCVKQSPLYNALVAFAPLQKKLRVADGSTIISLALRYSYIRAVWSSKNPYVYRKLLVLQLPKNNHFCALQKFFD